MRNRKMDMMSCLSNALDKHDNRFAVDFTHILHNHFMCTLSIPTFLGSQIESVAICFILFYLFYLILAHINT